MKKTLRNLAVAATLLVGATATTHAADLVQKNAYAYDIRVDGTDQRAPIVTYKLNGLASAVTVKAYANGEVVATKTGTVNQSNTVTLDIPDAAYGDITFAVDVTTKTTVSTPTQIKEKITGNGKSSSTYYTFFAPFGIGINNCTDAETFGRVLVTEGRNRAEIFGSNPTTTRFTSTANNGRGAMIYAFDPQMQPIANEQADGKYGFNAALPINTTEIFGEFHRIKYSADGRLFLVSGNPNGNGIYELNPNNLNEKAVPLLSANTPAWGLDLYGEGDDLTMTILTGGRYQGTNNGGTMEPSTVALNTYKIGKSQKLENIKFHDVLSGTGVTVNNEKGKGTYTWYGGMSGNVLMDPDGKGLYISQYRSGSNSKEFHYIHSSMEGNVDLNDYTTANPQGAMAYNKDYTLFARVEASNNITVYHVTGVNNGKQPTLVKKYSFTAGVGTNVNAIAFDYANNLYTCGNNNEYLITFQLPADIAGSSTSVPAPTSQSYYIEKVELPKLYVVGAFQGWNLENPVELEQDLQGEYEFTFPNKADEGFKLSFAKGDWAAFNAAAIGYSNDGCTILGGHSQQLYANDANNNSGNLYAPCPGTWSIKVNEDNLLTLNGCPDVLQDMIYVRGDITDWNPEDIYTLSLVATDKANPVMTDNGEYEFIGTFNDFYGDFKIADNNPKWFGAKGGATNITNKVTMESTSDGGNFLLDNKIYANVTITFYYNPVSGKSSWMNFSGTQRNHYAYGLNMIEPQQRDGDYVFKFYSTGDVDYAYIHFIDPNYTPAEVKTLGVPVDETEPGIQTWKAENIQKGENAEKIPSTWFARDCEYTWAVELAKDITSDIKTQPVSVGGGRAAVACFTDPAYPEVYGYTVIGRSNNGGIDIYDPTGKQIASALFANNAAMGGVNPGMAETDATPSDATTQGNRVLFSCQGATANGIVAIDIDKIVNGVETAPYAVYTKHDIRTVGVLGTGAETNLVVFNRNLGAYGQLEYNKIGTKNETDDKFTTLSTVTSSQLQNGRVFVATTDKGFFFSQHRGDGMGTSGLNGLGFVSFPDLKYVWNISTYKINYPDMLPTSTGGVAVNHAQNLLAVTTYTGIYMFDLSWNEDGTPNIGTAPKEIITYPFGNGGNITSASDIKFDKDDNLHIINQTYGYYRVLFNDTKSMSSKTFTVDDNVTGIEEVGVEAVDTEAVYYNLNGVRVEKGNLTPGVYVKVVGKTSTKVVIK